MTGLEIATEELRDAMVPLPADYLEDLSPQAALLLCWEAAKTALTIVVAAGQSLGADATAEQPTVSTILNGCAAALAGYTVALVALRVLPPEAEQAISAGPR